MSEVANTISDAVQRLRDRDFLLKVISLNSNQHMDEEIAELIDCLLLYPDGVERVYLGDNRLTDQVGIKLARYLSVSTTIQSLSLQWNRFTVPTYLAVAAALRINTSLQYLYLYVNGAVEKSSVDAAFVDALILNPNRTVDSRWSLYSLGLNDFYRLKSAAEEIGHPSMQALVTNQLIRVA